ncbi:MAG: hypothetical protein IE909_15970, partial [Campylobacterales bacterium]|nr:hypothetical protein [Campylobacterales bacterium]
RQEILYGLFLFIPILSIVFTVIYFLRDYIVFVLFSPEFNPVSDLFLWQLLGDLFKVSGTFFGILLAAKAKHFKVILVNVIFSVLFICFAYLYYFDIGLEGVVFAHFVNSVLYLLFVALLSLDLIYEKRTNSNNTDTDI